MTSLRGGVKRFVCGFIKKIILANNLSLAAERFFAIQTGENTVVGAWLGAAAFSLQIFYDFSGYSDMAIGLGQMFGFQLEENFNYPYISKSVTEFWRRWHISLSQWFRDYVYIPLGGSRVSVFRHIVNLAIVWLLTGLWHGAAYSFVFWGFIYFIALTVEKYIIRPEQRKSRLFACCYQILTLVYVICGWVIFNSDSLQNGLRYLLSMTGVYYGNALLDAECVLALREYGVFIAAGIIFATPIAPWCAKHMKLRKLAWAENCIVPIIYMLGFFWAVSYLILGAHNPFIYFNF